jgi:hypothetical protein
MAPDTSRPASWRHDLIFALSNPEVPAPDGLLPKPPSERGWEEEGLPLEPAEGPHPIGIDLRSGAILFNQPATERFSNDRAVDRTFENEMRLS